MIARNLAPQKQAGQSTLPSETIEDRDKPVATRGSNEPQKPPPPDLPDVQLNNKRILAALLLTALASAFLAVAGIKYIEQNKTLHSSSPQQAGLGNPIVPPNLFQQPGEEPRNDPAPYREAPEETPVVAHPPTKNKPPGQVKATGGLDSIPRFEVPYVKLQKGKWKNPEGTLIFEAGTIYFIGKNGGNRQFHHLREQSFRIVREGKKIAVYIDGELTYRVLQGGAYMKSELARVQMASELLRKGR